MNTQQTVHYVETSPYIAHPVSVFELQLLLLVAVTCCVVGWLLAEKTTLRSVFTRIDETLGSLVGRAAGDTA